MKCKLCGKEFTPKYKQTRYCSDECKAAGHRARNRANYKRYYKHKPQEKRTCAVCGAEFTVKREGQVTCSEKCRSRLRTIKQYCNGLTGEEREAYKRESKRKNLEKAVQAWKEKAAKERQNKQPKERTWYNGTCKVCGNEFKTLNPSQVTCSKECSKKLEYARKQHRIPKEQIVDKDITLEALYRRDSGVCYLCGGLCDWNDRDAENNIVGDSYPSIDHVIPVARGGLHAWNNVRLAHFKCNLGKGVELVENAEDLIPDNAYEFKKEVPPAKKEVYQYDAAGNLVAVYPSTAQAERETGIKQRGIQNCARGETKRYRGFVWKYRPL